MAGTAGCRPGQPAARRRVYGRPAAAPARSREQEALGLLVPVLRRPDAGDDPALFAAALTAAAAVACYIDVSMARQFAEQGVQVARQLGDERQLSRALVILCDAYFFAGAPEAACPFGQEAVERARRLGDDVLLAEGLTAYLLTVDPARSGDLWAEAIACTERSGDHLINCLLHNNAGEFAFEAGDLPAARAHLEAAARAGKQIGFPETLVMASLSRVQRAEGDPAGARSTLEAVLRINRRNGNSSYMASAILCLACLIGDAGDWDQAAVLCGAAEAFNDQTGSPWEKSDVRDRQDLLDHARAHLGDEQLERACAQAGRSALSRPSTWLSGRRTRPNRHRRQSRPSSPIARPGRYPHAPSSHARQTPTRRARLLHRTPQGKTASRPANRAQRSGVQGSRLFVRFAALSGKQRAA